jgi:hypothetical protein
MKRMRQGSEYMEAVVDLRNKPDLKKSIQIGKDFISSDETIDIFLKFFDDLDELIVEATEEYE